MRPNDNALLTPAAMAAADRAAKSLGIAGSALMDHAGRAVAEAAMRRWQHRPVAVLCGPGNNGGDGFAAARHLAAAGWTVRLGLLGARDQLAGDAREQAARWPGAVEPLSPSLLDGAGLAIDAIFGAGLARPVEGSARATIEALARSGVPSLAVDVPSGLDGATGDVRGAAAPAAMTVTFFRKKPGHLLFPGRFLCGDLVLADIGIPAGVLDAHAPNIFENGPPLWLAALPLLSPTGHKYDRGDAVVLGGAAMTGAARLGARAAQRVGAGLVTLAAPAKAAPIYAMALESVIVRALAKPGDFAAFIKDKRKNALLLGPGGGVGAALRRHVREALATKRAVVLDADAITVFAGESKALFKALAGAAAVLTPHEGEFARLFALKGDKLARARAAARQAKAVILLKGSDTVIAAPDGRAAINANAPADLATAGAGDVLAGLVLGLLAQRVDAFEAACIAAWLHGESAREFGPGLIAEDLIDGLPRILRRLRAQRGALANDIGAL